MYISTDFLSLIEKLKFDWNSTELHNARGSHEIALHMRMISLRRLGARGVNNMSSNHKGGWEGNVQYRSKVSWQSLETRFSILNSRKLQGSRFESSFKTVEAIRDCSRIYQVEFRDFRVEKTKDFSCG